MTIEWSRIYDTGQCRVPERLLVSDGSWRPISCRALTAVLRHSKHGIILFDTGVAPRLNQVTAHWPGKLYRSIARFDCRPELSLVQQLERDGIHARDVHFVILSHVHADHLGGLLDFPEAEIVLSEEALAFACKMRGVQAVLKAFLPELLPLDFVDRCRPVSRYTHTLHTLRTCDLFEDGSVHLVDLPGHAPGHMGMLTRSNGTSSFFVADSCWHSRTVTHDKLPHPITRFIVHDWMAMKSTIHHIRQFLALHPEYTMIPSHCPLVAAKYWIDERTHVQAV
jgi:glyoxylase-like metal-dependent hydrolase (beta-lactamase superfamily II)